MMLQTTIGKKRYEFEVTPIVVANESLYFCIELNDGQLILARHLIESGKWIKATKDNISKALFNAIFKKIEKASVYGLLDKLFTLDLYKSIKK